MQGNAKTAWFVGGLVLLVLLASYTPKIAGGIVVLLVTVLALEIANKGLIG
jgi:hypothetical protein